jgi:hypothetical protein
MRRIGFVASLASTVALVAGTVAFAADTSASARLKLGAAHGAAARNVSVVAYSEVDGRPPFKLGIQESGGRWYLYMGHLWHRGWTIMDVTNPYEPEVVKFIPGPPNTWTIQMEVFDRKMITALERMPQNWGGDPTQPFDEGALIWDVGDPVNPVSLGHFRTGGTGTHRNGYYGGPYVHLAAGMPGYNGNIYVIIDITDPTNPHEVGRWSAPGQLVGETTPPGLSLHGPPYAEGNRAYLSYGSAGLVILDISDPTQPTLVGQLDFTPPFLSNIGVHSALPLTARKLALANSESIAEDCREALNHTSLVDLSNPSRPTLLSVFPVPVPPPGLPYTNFCQKGGRFGPHNINQNQQSPYVQKSDRLVYLTYFNAGLRIYDTSDPRAPREVGWFIPPDPVQRYGVLPTKLVLQTEDVLVDARGYIYITQKNQGLWILRFTGPEAP